MKKKLSEERRANKITELEKKLNKYEEKLAIKMKLSGQAVRTRFGDSFSDQLRDDTNALTLIIQSIEKELETLRTNK